MVTFSSTIMRSDAVIGNAYNTGMSSLPYAPEEVGARIKRLRDAYAMSGADMARLLDVKPQELSAWENGVRRPSIAKALPLLQHFQITLDWLFLGDPAKVIRISSLKLA